MFKEELKEKFKDIFGIEKVTYDSVSESQEQGCLFVVIERSKNTIKEGKAVAMVYGSASIFAPTGKIPYGFFSKSINSASNELTRDLFFTDIESSNQGMRDLIELGFSFVYLYRGQYDPDIGELTSINLTIEEE